jgi:leader peptidase (prepilin peptidase) / N-methyltransferase
MTAARVIAFALVGLLFGSFLTVVVHRAPRRESFIRGRSRCPSCQRTIEARDNIPVISYVLLRARCRHCGARISPEYPITELATAGLFTGAAVAFPDVYEAGVIALFLAVLLALALTDLHARIIPNVIVLPSLLLFAGALVAGRLLGRDLNLAGAAIGFVAFGGGLLIMALIRPGGMGMGDVKLAGLIGMVLGALGLRYVAVAAGLAILAGGAGALVALVAGRSRKTAIPFGPFLVAGAVAAAFWGSHIAHAYLSTVG